MKPGKLYIKIFLSFVVCLIVTEILVFGLFRLSAEKIFRSRFERFANAQAIIVKESIEEKTRAEPNMHPADNKPLKDLIVRLGEIYGAKVWLTTPDGTPLVQSSPGDIPDDIVRISEKRADDFKTFRLYHDFRKKKIVYIIIPVTLPKSGMGSIHVAFQERDIPHPDGIFLLGLVGIGVAIALLVIPVSRFITGRVKRLRYSALRIAEGDLSHRAALKGKDEIGELGRTFNTMADKLERMIRGGRELTANISHELRSPLARIRVAVELLQERWKRGDYKACAPHFKGVQEDIEELDRLINSILILSKLDIHEVPLKRERVDISELIKELLKRLRPTMSRKRLRLSTDLSSDALVFADQDALRTAISNILDNAVKFTPRKGDVIVRAHAERDGLRISITNSSEILSEEELIRIFEPFYRTERSRAAGSGLGLAIAKKIIERHGGAIEAKNSKKGLKIQMRLPMKLSGKRGL